MKIVQILDNKVHWITPYPTWDDVPPFAPDIILVEAPDEVQEGCLYDAAAGELHPPEPISQPLTTILEPTNAEVVQQINDLRVDLIIGGLIS